MKAAVVRELRKAECEAMACIVSRLQRVSLVAFAPEQFLIVRQIGEKFARFPHNSVSPPA
jgi:hypothetical protein